MAKTNLKTVPASDETVHENVTTTTTVVTNPEGEVVEESTVINTGNKLETPPAKETPKVGVVIRGSVAAIPEALLNRGKSTYNWSDMAVGDHKLVPKAEAAQARASAYAFARSKGRKFGSMAHGADKNYIEIWRLMDPTPAQLAAEQSDQDQSENEDENTDF